MAADQRLGSDVRSTLLANMVFALGQWAAVITVARLGTPQEVGYITLATALVTPIFAVAGLSLREARSVDMGVQHSNSDYFVLRVMATLVAVTISVGVILWQAGATGAVFAVVAFAVMLTRIPQDQSSLNYGIAQTIARFDVILRSQVLRTVLGLAAFVMVFAVSGQLAGAFAAQAMVWLLVVVMYERPALQAAGVDLSTGRLDGPRLRGIGQLAWWIVPLALSSAIFLAAMSVPRIVLAAHVTFEALGRFGAIFYVLTAAQLLLVAMAQATASRMAAAQRDGDRAGFLSVVRKIMLANLALGLVGLIVAILWGNALVALIYGPDYVDTWLVIIVAAIVAVQLQASVTQFSLNAGQRFRTNLVINLVCLAVAVGASLLLIPISGVHGAALAVLALVVTQLALGLPLLRRHIQSMG